MSYARVLREFWVIASEGNIYTLSIPGSRTEITEVTPKALVFAGIWGLRKEVEVAMVAAEARFDCHKKVHGEHVDGVLNNKGCGGPSWEGGRPLPNKYYVIGTECPRAVEFWPQRRGRKVRGGGGEKGADRGGVIRVAVGGETGPRVDESLANGSPVVVVFVWKGMVWEVGRSGARENVGSRETVVRASFGCGGRGADCRVRFRPGGKGGASAEEELSSIVHEGRGGGQRYGVRWS